MAKPFFTYTISADNSYSVSNDYSFNFNNVVKEYLNKAAKQRILKFKPGDKVTYLGNCYQVDEFVGYHLDIPVYLISLGENYPSFSATQTELSIYEEEEVL